jgi:hypothetical protein
VRLGTGGRLGDGAGQVIGGVMQLTPFEGRTGLLEVYVGGSARVVHAACSDLSRVALHAPPTRA